MKAPLENIRKDLIDKVRVVVIKVGSGVINGTYGFGLNKKSISSISRQVAFLKSLGKDVIIVSSGAVSAGIGELNVKNTHETIPYKQAAAAIGQSHLIETYERYLKKNGLKAAQILLTHADLADRLRYLNVKNTILTLLKFNIIPIINENDTVSTEEINFGDNDTLSSMVASAIDADLLLVLSDVDGLYTKDPTKENSAKMIEFVSSINPSIEKMAKGANSSSVGTGGMITKIKAAKIASLSGISTIVLNGRKKDCIKKVFEGVSIGTFFLADIENRMSSKKHWIAYTKKTKGVLTLDKGAINALVKRNKSLLPSGVLEVLGSFKMGDSISCVDTNNIEVARGLINYDYKDLVKIAGKKSSEVEGILGKKYYDEVIHKDNLVLI